MCLTEREDIVFLCLLPGLSEYDQQWGEKRLKSMNSGIDRI